MTQTTLTKSLRARVLADFHAMYPSVQLEGANGTRFSTYIDAHSYVGSLDIQNPPIQENVLYTWIHSGNILTGFTGVLPASVSVPSVLDGVLLTSISASAFSGTSIVSLSLPDSITTLDISAFASCSGLVSIGLTVGYIPYNTFDGCISLTSLYLPSVISIGGIAFQGCMSLASVYLPSVTDIGDSAFFGCRSLTSIDLPSLTALNFNLFDGCIALSSITVPSVVSIGDYIFNNCSALTTILIPAATIGSYVFASCTSLVSVQLTGVTSMGNNVFEGCTALTTLTINIVTPPLFASDSLAEVPASATINIPNVPSELAAWNAAVHAAGWMGSSVTLLH